MEQNSTPSNRNTQFTGLWKFLIPSFFGILLFMAPFPLHGNITIPVAALAQGLKDLLSSSMIPLVTAIVIFSAVMTVFCYLAKPKLIQRSFFLKRLFCPSLVWVVIRVVAAIAIFMCFYNIGPEIIIQENTGTFILYELLPSLFAVFLFAGLLLPLLLNFGLLEFIGTLLSKIMRPIFNLPGRCAIDCMASWLGDGSVGILLTNKQYEKKFYTQKEAAIVATTFSAVSITFSLIVLAQVKLERLFVPYYATICLSGFVAAVILPRIPPLCWKKDLFADHSEPEENRDAIPHQHSLFSWAVAQALHRANKTKSIKSIFLEGSENAIDMIFGILPVVMGLGTVALIIAEYTSIFSWLGAPFVPYLELLGVPDAVAASKTVMVGFADQFIPSVIASTSITNEMTRFIIAALSVTQLIYMSEVGALLLGSRIPINFLELIIIFILRTIITLPVIAGMAHLIF